MESSSSANFSPSYIITRDYSSHRHQRVVALFLFALVSKSGKQLGVTGERVFLHSSSYQFPSLRDQPLSDLFPQLVKHIPHSISSLPARLCYVQLTIDLSFPLSTTTSPNYKIHGYEYLLGGIFIQAIQWFLSGKRIDK